MTEDEKKLRLAIEFATGAKIAGDFSQEDCDLFAISYPANPYALERIAADILYEAITKKMEIMLTTEPWSAMKAVEEPMSLDLWPEDLLVPDLATVSTNPFKRGKADELVAKMIATRGLAAVAEWWSEYPDRREALENLKVNPSFNRWSHRLWNHTVAADLVILNLNERLRDEEAKPKTVFLLWESWNDNDYTFTGAVFASLASGEAYCEKTFPEMLDGGKSFWAKDTPPDGSGLKRGYKRFFWRTTGIQKPKDGHYWDEHPGAEPHYLLLTEETPR